jgi:hypothetical protein
MAFLMFQSLILSPEYDSKGFGESMERRGFFEMFRQKPIYLQKFKR